MKAKYDASVRALLDQFSDLNDVFWGNFSANKQGAIRCRQRVSVRLSTPNMPIGDGSVIGEGRSRC